MWSELFYNGRTTDHTGEVINSVSALFCPLDVVLVFPITDRFVVVAAAANRSATFAADVRVLVSAAWFLD
jgi:hypothetical protein